MAVDLDVDGLLIAAANCKEKRVRRESRMFVLIIKFSGSEALWDKPTNSAGEGMNLIAFKALNNRFLRN